MINDHPQYYWYFPYEDITDFKNGFIHEEFCVNIWRVIIIIFLILLILLITLTWYLYECKKKEDIKINKRKKENECIQNLVRQWYIFLLLYFYYRNNHHFITYLSIH